MSSENGWEDATGWKQNLDRTASFVPYPNETIGWIIPVALILWSGLLAGQDHVLHI